MIEEKVEDLEKRQHSVFDSVLHDVLLQTLEHVILFNEQETAF